MMRNYLLLSIKILKRRKFYAFVSLLGIAVTLMVLILVTSIIENFIHPAGPERNSDRFLIAAAMMLAQRNESGDVNRTLGFLGYGFIDKYLQGMETPELLSVYTDSSLSLLGITSNEATGYRDGVKIASSVKRTDANFWKILAFDFLEGRPISESEHREGANVAVLSESTRSRYFPNEGALGRTIMLDGSSYTVIGVVRDVSPLQVIADADVWIPIFAVPSTSFRSEERGEFAVLMLASSDDGVAAMRDEYQAILRGYRPPIPPGWQRPIPVEAFSYALTKAEFYARLIDNARGNRQAFIEEDNAAVRQFGMLLGGGMLLFMFLPVINLMNLNISRILERSGEIGVRKSFGASSWHLVRQFTAENLVITALGGILGFALAAAALYLAGHADLLPAQGIAINYRVFALGLLYILVFGLLSGVYPAWRMSRIDPVQALKGAV